MIAPRSRNRSRAVVEPARPYQAHAVRALSVEFADLGLLSARLPEFFTAHIADFLVAARDDRVVGCLGLAVLGRDLLLYNFCVAAEEQGRGLGRLLVDAAEHAARDLRCSALLTSSKDDGAWFLHQGFEPATCPVEMRRARPRFALGSASRVLRRPLSPLPE